MSMSTETTMPVVPAYGNGGFGGENGWFWIVILFLFGWGRGGNGFGGDGSLNTDFAILERKLDSQNNGLCDLGYSALSLNNQTNMAIKDCCCETQQMFAQNRYDNALNHCATLQAIDKVGDRIVEKMNADRAEAMKEEINALRLAASQSAQNQYIINQLRPAPIPAFQVAAPWQYTYNNGCGCG